MPQTARGASGPLCGGFRPAAICASSPSGSVTASSPQTAGSGSPSGVNPSSASAASSSTHSRITRAISAPRPSPATGSAQGSSAAASGNSANSSGRSPRSAATAPQTSSDLRWRTRVHLSRATSMAAAKERAGSERHRRKTARASTTHASRSSSAAVGMVGPPAGHLALMKLCTETWPESRPGVEFFSVFRPGAPGSARRRRWAVPTLRLGVRPGRAARSARGTSADPPSLRTRWVGAALDPPYPTGSRHQ